MDLGLELSTWILGKTNHIINPIGSLRILKRIWSFSIPNIWLCFFLLDPMHWRWKLSNIHPLRLHYSDIGQTLRRWLWNLYLCPPLSIYVNIFSLSLCLASSSCSPDPYKFPVQISWLSGKWNPRTHNLSSVPKASRQSVTDPVGSIKASHCSREIKN